MAEGRGKDGSRKARSHKCEILVLNQVAQVGLKRFPPEKYSVSKEAKDPEAILVRSADLHKFEFGPSLKAIGRAGAGVNNIPVGALTKRGVPVFNAPGANANAVKELVLAGMLIAARNLGPAIQFVSSQHASADLDTRIEEGKKQFAGVELPGHTLGLIGLGKIGSLVADAAIRLGMNVVGFDPHITVEAAWSLPSQVKRAGAVEEVLKASHFVSLHVPLAEKTRHLVNTRNLELFRPGAVLLNFSREGVVADDAVLKGLASHRLKWYVTDFPSAPLLGKAGVIALPHLGASTREAEDNSAIMVVDQLREYLEDGNLRNAVNFPEAVMPREAPYRLAIANANVPDMLGAISHALGRRKINIHNMLNKSKGEMAYTLVDADSPVPSSVVDELCELNGVLAVRYLPADV
jgi:D-3-phosphoglycerate dehydrogenase / 2-oxoglutarate reductase